ncbi:MAG: hypothetical protein M3N26_11010 [Pseudomonadota bacterium]|nr:hypothetical protein [Pseudomonadota bacterium]
MPIITELTPKAQAESATEVTDRRRPGRLSKVNSELLPILRGEDSLELPDPSIDFPEDDQLSAARGLMFGAVLSAPFWIGMAVIGRWLLS